jgi:hypothetical protein
VSFGVALFDVTWAQSCLSLRERFALAEREPIDTDPGKFLPNLIGSDVLDEVLADTDRPEKNKSSGKAPQSKEVLSFCLSWSEKNQSVGPIAEMESISISRTAAL